MAGVKTDRGHKEQEKALRIQKRTHRTDIIYDFFVRPKHKNKKVIITKFATTLNDSYLL